MMMSMMALMPMIVVKIVISMASLLAFVTVMFVMPVVVTNDCDVHERLDSYDAAMSNDGQ